MVIRQNTMLHLVIPTFNLVFEMGPFWILWVTALLLQLFLKESGAFSLIRSLRFSPLVNVLGDGETQHTEKTDDEGTVVTIEEGGLDNEYDISAALEPKDDQEVKRLSRHLSLSQKQVDDEFAKRLKKAASPFKDQSKHKAKSTEYGHKGNSVTKKFGLKPGASPEKDGSLPDNMVLSSSKVTSEEEYEAMKKHADSGGDKIDALGLLHDDNFDDEEYEVNGSNEYFAEHSLNDSYQEEIDIDAEYEAVDIDLNLEDDEILEYQRNSKINANPHDVDDELFRFLDMHDQINSGFNAMHSLHR